MVVSPTDPEWKTNWNVDAGLFEHTIIRASLPAEGYGDAVFSNTSEDLFFPPDTVAFNAPREALEYELPRAKLCKLSPTGCSDYIVRIPPEMMKALDMSQLPAAAFDGYEREPELEQARAPPALDDELDEAGAVDTQFLSPLIPFGSAVDEGYEFEPTPAGVELKPVNADEQPFGYARMERQTAQESRGAKVVPMQYCNAFVDEELTSEMDFSDAYSERFAIDQSGGDFPVAMETLRKELLPRDVSEDVESSLGSRSPSAQRSSAERDYSPEPRRGRAARRRAAARAPHVGGAVDSDGDYVFPDEVDRGEGSGDDDDYVPSRPRRSRSSEAPANSLAAARGASFGFSYSQGVATPAASHPHVLKCSSSAPDDFIGKYSPEARLRRLEEHRRRRRLRDFSNPLRYRVRREVAQRRARVHGRFVKVT